MQTLTKYLNRINIISVLLIVLSLFFNQFAHAAVNKKLPTYFQYNSSELLTLKKLSSSHEMNEDELRKWDKIMFDLVKKDKLSGILAARIYAYVYIAQRDAAFLSNNIKQQFMGSLEPISSKVLCLFFPSHCKDLEKKTFIDPYSEKLADLVLEKIKLVMESDKKQLKVYPQKLKGKNYWSGISPFVGQDTGSAKTWFIKSPNDFLPSPPPVPQSSEWRKQLKQTKEALNNITAEQKKSIYYWAGTPSTVTPSGIWLILANQYMDSERIPLTKQLLVRSNLAAGIFDAFIAVFHAKYTYWVKRPFMLDRSLKTVLPTPNHPSYPAGHACLSATAATILSYYFPAEKKEWWRKAHEASQGRVIGGIHFPIDIQQGIILGRKIGRAVVYSSLNASQQ